ncbi:hypothetical protein CHUAL_006499 [Chamberlinius hualienensis]
MNTAIVLGFAIIITAATLTQQELQCNGRYYNTVNDAIDGVDNCTYQANKFTASCVAASCPELNSNSLCPFKNNGDIDINKVKKTLQTANDCLGTKLPICNVSIDPIPIPNFTDNTNELFQQVGLSGNCLVAGGYIYNASSVVISLADNYQKPTLPLNITISIKDLVYIGNFSCKVKKITSNNSSSSEIVRDTDNVTFRFDLTISAFTSEYLDSVTKPKVVVTYEKILVTISKISFDNDSGLNGNVTETFKDSLQTYLNKSKMSQSFAEFIAAFVSSALQATIQQC